MDALRREDQQRIKHAERKISESRWSARRKQCLDRKLKQVNKSDYIPRGFSVTSVPESLVNQQSVTITFVDEVTALCRKNDFFVFV